LADNLPGIMRTNDHAFSEPVKGDKGEVLGMKNHTPEAIAAGLAWLKAK
jgi:hypothetical protein